MEKRQRAQLFRVAKGLGRVQGNTTWPTAADRALSGDEETSQGKEQTGEERLHREDATDVTVLEKKRSKGSVSTTFLAGTGSNGRRPSSPC